MVIRHRRGIQAGVGTDRSLQLFCAGLGQRQIVAHPVHWFVRRRSVMNIEIQDCRAILFAAILAMLGLSACASNADKPPSQAYESATAKSQPVRCPSGHVLTCESRKTGRIRFGKMGGGNLESCSCEPESGMPVNSPLPGIY